MFPPLFPHLDPAETILSSSICLPRSKEAHTTRSHIALNLLSCLNTLATSPPLTMEALTGSRMRKYDKDEFNCVVRFNGERSMWHVQARRLASQIVSCVGFMSNGTLVVLLSCPQLTVVGGATQRHQWRPSASPQTQTFFWEALGCTVDEEHTMLKSRLEV